MWQLDEATCPPLHGNKTSMNDIAVGHTTIVILVVILDILPACFCMNESVMNTYALRSLTLNTGLRGSFR